MAVEVHEVVRLAASARGAQNLLQALERRRPQDIDVDRGAGRRELPKQRSGDRPKADVQAAFRP